MQVLEKEEKRRNRKQILLKYLYSSQFVCKVLQTQQSGCIPGWSMGVRENSGLEGLGPHGRAPDGGPGQPEQLPRRVGQAGQLGLLTVGSHQAFIRSRTKRPMVHQCRACWAAFATPWGETRRSYATEQRVQEPMGHSSFQLHWQGIESQVRLFNIGQAGQFGLHLQKKLDVLTQQNKGLKPWSNN